MTSGAKNKPSRPNQAKPKTATSRTLDWRLLLWGAVIVVTLILMIRADLRHQDWVEKLSMEGSPPPELDAESPTGYVLGQRHFLGAKDRGATYRWIAYTQQLAESGFFASTHYTGDTAPVGRPQLLPKLYAGWVTAIAGGVQISTGDPFPIAVEKAALWEPVVSHAMVFLGAVLFMWFRFGAASAGATGVFFALFPPIAGQFIPGTLSAEPWALFLATYAIALNLPRLDSPQTDLSFSTRSAVACGFSLWLDPSFGFPAVLITAIAGAVIVARRDSPLPFLRWAITGSLIVSIGWLIDRSPWDLAAGELRYSHPLYAVAWLGIGLGLHGWRILRDSGRSRKRGIALIAAAAAVASALFVTQISHAYKGWLYPSPSLRRLASLDETTFFRTVIDWFGRASLLEIALIALPVFAVTLALTAFRFSKRDPASQSSPSFWRSATVVACALVLTFFLIRWSVVATLLSVPIFWYIATELAAIRRQLLASLGAAYLVGLFAWNYALPPSLHRPSEEVGLAPVDASALLYRHFSHWMANHSQEREVVALAPPELSDSLVYHGGLTTLMSTAWESHPGHVAASRILSAPESTEAEAVLDSREVTHLVLPSWDPVLPLLVRLPEGETRQPLYELLQRWVHPRYLRPIPYKMPPIQGFETEKLPVFQATVPQDEALSLSRLAEYFVEMNRPEPATLVAEALAKSFPDDPNAAIAKAMVYADIRNLAAFRTELAKLADNVERGLIPRNWDRRLLRAIVLAVGNKRELAKAELEACVDTMTEDSLYQITPLQAFQLTQLMERHGLEFPTREIADLARARSAEYSAD